MADLGQQPLCGKRSSLAVHPWAIMQRRMYRFIAPFALAAAAASPLMAQPAPANPSPQLKMEQQTALRCAVAFGLVAGQQAAGDARASAYPAMDPRGKEFFVRTTARLMDELALNRDQISALALAEMQALKDGGRQQLDQIMPACLMMLDVSGV